MKVFQRGFVRAAVVGLVVIAAAVSSSGASAVSVVSGPDPTEVVLDRMATIVHGPDFQSLVAAQEVGGPLSSSTVRRVTDAVNALVASPEFLAVSAELAPQLPEITTTRGVPEFLYWVGQGNSALLSNINLWAGVVVPGILACQIGNPGCVTSWLIFGAVITQISVQTAVWSYVTAVLELP